MCSWYTYMAEQQPQPDSYLMLQFQTQPVVAPPIHQVHRMPLAMTPQGQHYVYVSTPTPQTVQNVPVGYSQTVQTPMKMEIGNSSSVTLPVEMTPQAPESTPKTPKSDSKGNSDSDENDSEKSEVQEKT